MSTAGFELLRNLGAEFACSSEKLSAFSLCTAPPSPLQQEMGIEDPSHCFVPTAKRRRIGCPDLDAQWEPKKFVKSLVVVELGNCDVDGAVRAADKRAKNREYVRKFRAKQPDVLNSRLKKTLCEVEVLKAELAAELKNLRVQDYSAVMDELAESRRERAELRIALGDAGRVLREQGARLKTAWGAIATLEKICQSKS